VETRYLGICLRKIAEGEGSTIQSCERSVKVSPRRIRLRCVTQMPLAGHVRAIPDAL